MKCYYCVLPLLLTLSCYPLASGTETKIRENLRALHEKIETLKTLHATEINHLKEDLENYKKQMKAAIDSEKPALDRMTVEDLRAEIGEVRDSINATALQIQLTTIRHEVKQARVEAAELGDQARAQQQRADRLETELGRLRYEAQQMRTSHNQLSAHVAKIAKEMKTKHVDDVNKDSFNEVEEDAWERHAHRLRHQNALTHHVTKLAHQQELLVQSQQELQTQVTEVQNRLDHYTQPNWNLMSAKVELLEIENKIIREELNNNSQKISDFDKLHASMLELREEVEGIENKADKTIPEIRKEISKLDINYAQLNAQSSYLKEDQENLRQSVKAIAVSVSNAVDRADSDRLALHQLNQSVSELDTRAKRHFYRLSDHILKSEANHDHNLTESITLPELIKEVKELQPVESEYQDLVKQLPRDCSTVTGPPGVYLIRPGRVPKEVWCAGGGTLLQRRVNGTIDFNRRFADYVRGFGDASFEFWLGLEAMHLLTADNCTSMRIDMVDVYGAAWYAQYENLYVGDAGSGYRLELSGFKGNASDAFQFQNHMEFSAVDRDRDTATTHCAFNYECGWWFSRCQQVNINGRYNLGLSWFDSSRNEWIAVATSEMRLYRRPICK